jgi:hypothetical protein
VKAFRVRFPTAIKSSALNSKKFCSHHGNTLYVADSVDQHNMSPTMFITLTPTLLANINTRLRRRRDTRACRARTFSKTSTVWLRPRGAATRRESFSAEMGSGHASAGATSAARHDEVGFAEVLTLQICHQSFF